MAGERANPFPFDDTDIDLSGFEKKTAARPDVPASAIREMSEKHNFPSRDARPATLAPAPRRRATTGRNQQLNVKCTDETARSIRQIADELYGGSIAVAFEAALEALSAKLGRTKPLK